MRMIALQSCVGFCRTATRVSPKYVHVSSLMSFPAPSHPSRSSQNVTGLPVLYRSFPLVIFFTHGSYMEKAMAPHSSTLAWKIPWAEEPGRLQSMGSQRVWTRLNDFTFTFHFHGLEKEMATHSSVLAWRIPATEEPGGLPSMGLHRAGHD